MESQGEQEKQTEIFKRLKDVENNCLGAVEKELKCDLLQGPNDAECERKFKVTEDCYMRSLCKEAWTDALSCLQNKPRVACMRTLERARACKEAFFAPLFTPQLQSHLKTVTSASNQCEAELLKFVNCSDKLSPHYKECLDREIIYQQCFMGNLVPSELWRDWKLCERQHPDNPTSACRFELEEIRIANRERAQTIVKSLGFTKADIDEKGGPDGTVEFMTTIFRGSHFGNVFKDYDPRREAFKPYSRNSQPTEISQPQVKK